MEAKHHSKRTWIPSETDRLRKWMREGIPIRYICDLLGRDLHDVTGKMYELSLPAPPRDVERPGASESNLS